MPAANTLPDDPIPSQTAFFLDLDGTLAEIVPDPDRASVRPETLAALGRLRTAAAGAVAVVSGRSIAQLDRMLGPLQLPLAGVHGLERRGAGGRLSQTPVDPEAQRRLVMAVRRFVEDKPGLLAELKPGAVALHYRKRPEFAPDCLAFAIDLARSDARIRPIEGKKVIELKLAARTKGDAIAEFMTEAPFRGRTPFFAGDDITDEAGFAVVNAMGGVSLKVGPGETRACFRVESTAAFAAWLEGLARTQARNDRPAP